MQCHEFRNTLGAWMEGEAHPGAPAHLASCANCRALVADLEAIRGAAAGMVEAETEPPARLWVSLRAQLEAEGMIREPASAGWSAGFFGFLPRPAVAGAYLGLLLAAAAFVGMQTRPRTEVAMQQPAGMPQHSEVEQRTLHAMHEHNPAVADTFTRSLSQVDNCIRLCEKTVREQPRNELAREYLYSAYQQKADLLATITERGAMGD